MAIMIKSASEIEAMRKANRVVARVLELVGRLARPGITTLELDREAERLTREMGARPAFKGYQGAGPYPFPACLCTSVNDEVVHGIPSDKRRLMEGDILSVDFGAVVDGLYGDGAVTIPIGRVSPEAEKLMRVTREALELAVTKAVRAGAHLGDIGAVIQDHVEAAGFSVVRDFVGHGIGRSLHEEPQIPHYRTGKAGPKLRPGMVLAIEPMVNQGSWKVKTAADGWTQKTIDGKLSAHFEFSVLVTENGAEVLNSIDQVGER
ncbi:MAG: type I methionyl aminopeptidase [Deltaproteobacteria bacterium]|nr:MAG: type I methionyl aminopeptidase [Deltaproteobacteria bacterium]